MWWNLENLFDVENSPTRPEWLQKKLAGELKGWNEKILDKKISQISSIISKVNNKKGPDILGVCEVENEVVIRKLVDALNLPDRKYHIIHEDTDDKRGIDVAFIIDATKFIFKRKFSYSILKREATRDIFQVNLKIKKTKQDLIVIGNHWPSRMGGDLESEPYRMTAGETLSYWHERIIEEKTKEHLKNIPILVMGDFNDEPHNRSITKYALSVNSIDQMLSPKAKKPYLYNLMWDLMAKGLGTHFQTKFTMLDQFMISKGFLAEDAPLKIKRGSVEIIQFPEMVKKGFYKTPLRFGRPSKNKENKKSLDVKGFSDHFPISLVIEEKQ
jgi:hypothetical protein